MANNLTPRPVPQAKPRPLTEEEKKVKIMQFLQQRRESFSINILCSLLQNNPGIHPEDVVIKAVALADILLEKLYPLPEAESTDK